MHAAAALTGCGSPLPLSGAFMAACANPPYHPPARGRAPRAPQSGELDPEVLSTLPPSLQLELLMRAREARRAANREAFEARAGVPAAFSTFQMQQYLAAVGFRWGVASWRPGRVRVWERWKRPARDVGRPSSCPLLSSTLSGLPLPLTPILSPPTGRQVPRG